MTSADAPDTTITCGESRVVAVPEIIPIAYEPNYRTDMIGRYAGGQFFTSITYAFPGGFRNGEDWEDAKRLYAVLHRFDFDGRHVDSDIWCAGTWWNSNSAAARRIRP